MSKSIIADYNELVTFNGGVHNNMWNKCGVISIGNSMGIDSGNYIELITEMLGLHIDEQLDFNDKKWRLQEICDLLQIGISVHCARKLGNNLIKEFGHRVRSKYLQKYFNRCISIFYGMEITLNILIGKKVVIFPSITNQHIDYSKKIKKILRHLFYINIMLFILPFRYKYNILFILIKKLVQHSFDY